LDAGDKSITAVMFREFEPMTNNNPCMETDYLYNAYMNSIIELLSDKIQRRDPVVLHNTYTILFLGASTVSAEWVHPNWRDILEYVIKDTLETRVEDPRDPYFHIRFVNAGLNGANTNEFIKYATVDIARFQPDLTILIGGSNDVDELTVAQHVQNITTLKRMMSESSGHFAYCTSLSSTSSNFNDKYNPYRTQVLEIPPCPNEIVIDLFTEYKQYDLDKLYTFVVEFPQELASMGLLEGGIDYLHPNTLGQAYIAKILLDKIFNIQFDPELYVADIRSDKKYPRY
jgi:lysophospholipase L1-like esterase